MIDEDRPTLHLTPRTGWINDPLSLTWHGGEYHVFFQYVPERTSWAPSCHWGHATSKDLRTWTEQDVILGPGEGDDGIWSGSLVVDGDQATIFYTSIETPDFSIGRIRMATPNDDFWGTWTKGDVVAEAPAGAGVQVYRDPFVFRDGDKWRMLVGANLEGTTAAALSYSSADLETWNYDGIAASRKSELTNPVWTGKLWECPQIFSIDGVDVLITSVWDDDVLHYVAYGTGKWEDGAFEVENWGRLTWGDSYYAPSFFRDEKGQPGLVFWLRGIQDREGATWAGAMSVPHLLELEGNVLVARPHPEAVRGPGIMSHIAIDLLDVREDEGAQIIHWDPAGGNLVVQRDGSTVVALERTDEGIVVSAPGAGWQETVPLAASLVQVLLDGPVVEVSTGAGLFAAPLRTMAAISH